MMVDGLDMSRHVEKSKLWCKFQGSWHVPDEIYGLSTFTFWLATSGITSQLLIVQLKSACSSHLSMMESQLLVGKVFPLFRDEENSMTFPKIHGFLPKTMVNRAFRLPVSRRVSTHGPAVTSKTSSASPTPGSWNLRSWTISPSRIAPWPSRR